MTRFILYLTIIGLGLMTSCQEDSTSENKDLTMPIYLSVAADGMANRSPGDPGVGDNQQFPRHLYVLFVERLLDAGKVTNKFHVDRMQERLDETKWVYQADKKVYYYSGPLMMYLTHKDIAATGEETDDLGASRVYAITSYSPINFEWVTKKTEVENLKLDISDGKQVADFDLQNVYASPLADVNNGKVTKRAKFLYQTEVTCYHVASRVDIQWDVNPKKHAEHWLTQVAVPDMPTVGYFFKPTEATGTGTTKTYTFSTDAGSQWYGRCVFHVLDKNPLKCQYTLNSGPKDGGEHRPGAITAGYANWYRVNAKFGY